MDTGNLHKKHPYRVKQCNDTSSNGIPSSPFSPHSFTALSRVWKRGLAARQGRIVTLKEGMGTCMHTHTYIYIYIYIYTPVYIYIIIRPHMTQEEMSSRVTRFVSVCTKRNVFLWHNHIFLSQEHALVTQEGIYYCVTRRHVCMRRKKTCPLVSQENNMSSCDTRKNLLVTQEDMSSCDTRRFVFLWRKQKSVLAEQTTQNIDFCIPGEAWGGQAQGKEHLAWRGGGSRPHPRNLAWFC